MTKIDIISGFLGSGKTTLIKKLVKDSLSNQKIVIIENEFGEIGIDGGFLKESGIQITEMNSGCICCSLVGDFGKALEQVLAEYSPDRIIIEPSGVGKLSDVINAVLNINSNEIELNSFTTVVDAKKCKIYHKNFGEFFNNQIESAKTVILSHVKGLEHEKLHKCTDIIKEHNEKALIVTTDWDELTGDQLLNAMENGNKEIEDMLKEHHHHEHHHHHHDEECDCGCHGHEHHHHHHDEECDCGCHDHEHHHHHADEVFVSWGIQSAEKYSEETISDILNKFSESDDYGTVLRAKGIVESNDGSWIHFDYVPGEPEIRKGSADITGKICIIGVELNEEKLQQLFNQR